jgi:hypothetical protein
MKEQLERSIKRCEAEAEAQGGAGLVYRVCAEDLRAVLAQLPIAAESRSRDDAVLEEHVA